MWSDARFRQLLIASIVFRTQLECAPTFHPNRSAEFGRTKAHKKRLTVSPRREPRRARTRPVPAATGAVRFAATVRSQVCTPTRVRERLVRSDGSEVQPATDRPRSRRPICPSKRTATGNLRRAIRGSQSVRWFRSPPRLRRLAPFCSVCAVHFGDAEALDSWGAVSVATGIHSALQSIGRLE
jgi:hypothetical protein